MRKFLLSLIFIQIIFVFNVESVKAATTAQTVTVDFGSSAGPATHRAAGYLGGDITDTLPSDTTIANYWTPLKLQLFTWIRPKASQTYGYTFNGLNRAKAMNAYYQVKIYHDPGDMSLGINSPWGQEVKKIAQAATATNYSKIQLDILNEPDWSDYWPGNVNDPRILEAWRIAYDAAKSVNPNIELVGPNVLAGLSTSWTWLKTTFLPTMKNENRLPDTLSWHEINTNVSQINSRIQEMRTFMTQNNINVKNISINEYNYTNNHTIPATAVHFISQLEKGKVQSASRACWEEIAGGSYDCSAHINGMLDLSGLPRSVWWVYKYYGDMGGDLVTTIDPPTYTSIASKETGVSRVLIGAIGSETLLSVRMTNLANTSYNVKIERIPDSGKTALPNPLLVQEYKQTPVSGVIEANISNVQQNQAFSVTLTSNQTPPPTTKPGDTDGDNDVDVFDYNNLTSDFGTSNPRSDFNKNGTVDIFDYSTLVSNFGK